MTLPIQSAEGFVNDYYSRAPQFRNKEYLLSDIRKRDQQYLDRIKELERALQKPALQGDT